VDPVELQVYKTTGIQLLLMKVVGAFMFLVAVAATIASCQNIIVSWVSWAAAWHKPVRTMRQAALPCHRTAWQAGLITPLLPLRPPAVHLHVLLMSYQKRDIHNIFKQFSLVQQPNNPNASNACGPCNLVALTTRRRSHRCHADHAMTVRHAPAMSRRVTCIACNNCTCSAHAQFHSS
jgi:hypothetical protein